jgi:predicted ester cyclase
MKKITTVSGAFIAIALMSFTGIDDKTIARNFYESYAANNMDKSFNDYIAAGVINHTMGGAFDRDKWLAYEKSYLAAVSGFKVTILEQVAEGDKVATHFIMEGKHTGNFSGMPATGNATRLEVISIDVIKNGKIVEHNSIGDFTGFMQQFAKK